MGHRHEHHRRKRPGGPAGFGLDPEQYGEQRPRRQRPGGRGGRGDDWIWGRGFGGHGPGGPPPWIAGLFGPPRPERRGGPRVRRGDVRAAIIDVLREANAAEEPINGYQVIGKITERSDGAWKPSPGSVYPTIQQLQDEGLVESDDDRGRRTLRLTEAGAQYATDNADELAAVWAPFESSDSASAAESGPDVRAEIGQVMSAVWQIVSAGSEAQRHAAVDILVETRRQLYGVLADGPEPERDA